MFANKKTILFITKSKIKIVSVAIDNKPKENIVGEINWTPGTLQDVLLKFKKYIGDNARMLLSEDFVYTITASLPTGIILNKDIARQKAQELIPEDLNQTLWDFKEIANVSPRSVQVVAVVRSLFEELSKTIAKTGLNIEAIEPLSFALARFTKKQENPLLFIYINGETLLVLAQEEEVLATERLTSINAKIINQFLAFTKEKFAQEPEAVIFCGNTKDVDLKQYVNEKFKVQIQNISPIISLAYKYDLKGFPNFSRKTSIQKHHFLNITAATIVIGVVVIMAIYLLTKHQ